VSHPPGWDHPHRAALLAGLDQEVEGVVAALLGRAEQVDDLDEHEAAATLAYDLMHDPDLERVGLAAGVAILAIRLHRRGL
jgi:hypothetical protein